MTSAPLHRVRAQAHDGQRFTRALERLFARHAEVEQAFDDGFAYRAARVERAVGVLEHDLDAAAYGAQRRPRQRAQVFATHHHVAGGGFDQAHDAARHRGLARPGLAHHADDFARVQGKAHAFHRKRAVSAGRQRDRQVFNLKQRRHGSPLELEPGI
ncbi:hypothetical protein G6F68_016661 [Rhizopus microsporus]|nr:hypothetical protein G6F68_016661 [Rhizopus microsporus]